MSHASEDKEAFVRPLVERLRLEGLSVWYDELTLTLGDSLRLLRQPRSLLAIFLVCLQVEAAMIF